MLLIGASVTQPGAKRCANAMVIAEVPTVAVGVSARFLGSED